MFLQRRQYLHNIPKQSLGLERSGGFADVGVSLLATRVHLTFSVHRNPSMAAPLGIRFFRTRETEMTHLAVSTG